MDGGVGIVSQYVGVDLVEYIDKRSISMWPYNDLDN